MTATPMLVPPDPTPWVIDALFDHLGTHPELSYGSGVVLSTAPMGEVPEQLMLVRHRAPQKWGALGYYQKDIALAMDLVLICYQEGAGELTARRVRARAYQLYHAVEAVLRSPKGMAVLDIEGRALVHVASIGDADCLQNSLGTKRWCSLRFTIDCDIVTRFDLGTPAVG